MRKRIGITLVLLAWLGACGGGGVDEEPPAATRTARPQGIVLGAGSASAPGGHRVEGGVIGGVAVTESITHQVRGGLQP